MFQLPIEPEYGAVTVLVGSVASVVPFPVMIRSACAACEASAKPAMAAETANDLERVFIFCSGSSWLRCATPRLRPGVALHGLTTT